MTAAVPSRTAFVSWVPYHRRSELLARAFQATAHYVYHGRQGKLWQAPFRYVLQAWQTWRRLRRQRPEAVFVQNPPIFAVLVVALYARLHGVAFVVDSHTSAFVSSRWRWSLGLHRWLSRHAAATIVHNESQARIVEAWQVPYLVIAFSPGDYPPGEPYRPAGANGNFRVAVVSTYEADEPLDVVLEAAAGLPDVEFYVTGNSERIDPELLAQKPENCHLTGYLSYEQYVGLLRGAGAVLDLTERDHTLLMGGFEAISLGTPLITSDWPVLRDYFHLGTVHVPNDVEGVRRGVRRAQRDGQALRDEMVQLHQMLVREYARQADRLRDMLTQRPGEARQARQEWMHR